ncbi:TP901 family phage tail tape measure protein [Propionicimonas paludicola]|uniref:TP901 family phage tail tape measure protein n=1 Tax=Propionicimonas paludicola TaxID=185243 RepID=A0A2A9CRX9_9ACTN|nr:phage tail tape measure protein [Propionicimonas paludicola]PFG17184.1 TP901 family phage tail tape measure protein [Propionicimonas paludicola]
MKDRTITLRIGANITDLQGKLRKAQNDMKDWTNQAQKDLQKNRAQWSSVSNTVGGVGLAMVGMSALAVKGFADFDKSMSKVKASGADAANNLDALRAAAIKAGADTQYSAADAADAITDLAKAGVSAKDILGGGLSGALSLAASGQMEVKDAAEVTATALSQFNLPGTKASHVADLLAAGAGKARGEVSDLGMALSQGGLVASQTGLSLEETTAALSAFAAKGMLGSDAGTSLKTMLQRLTPQSDKAQEQFDALGISAYDASGNFVGLANFAGQLKDKMSSLTPQARNAAMSVMFGSDAVRAANVLFTEGADGIQKWTDAVDDSGFAMRQASTLTDNLAGDWERLSGSIDTVFIQSGKGANDTLRGMAQSANAVVDAIGQIPEPALNAMVLLTGAGGLGLSGAAGMMKLVGAISDTKDALDNLGKGATIAKFSIAGVGAALGIATIAVSLWASEAAAARQRTDELASTLEVTQGKAKATGETFVKLNEQMASTRTADWGPSVLDMMNRVGVSAADAQQYILGNADAIAKVNEQANRYTFANGAMAGGVGLISQLNSLKASYEGSITATEQKAKADQEAGVASDGSTSSLKRQTDAIDDQASALKELDKDIFDHANELLKLSGTEIGWQAALDDTAAAIKKNGKAQRTASGNLDLNTKKGRENRQALNGLAQSSIAYAQALIDQGASGEKVQRVMQRSRDEFIKQAVAAGMTSTAAKQLADDLQLIPSDVPVLIKTDLERKGIDEWTAYKPGDKYPNIKPKLTQSTFNVTLKTVWRINGGPGFGLADGGAVYGPGTATSDSIPARLSNGEHVLTASDVQKAGGQSAIYRLRAGIQSGAAKFANGGAVDFADQVRAYAGGGMVQTAASNVSYVNSTSTQATRVVYLSSTVNYPVAEPASVATNRDLQYAAALGGDN